MDSPSPLKRKIAAILAADVAGYSRLMAEAEERTLHELAAARDIFDRLVTQGGGRIFNTAGDSVMCEFDSAVEAVRTAIDIQTRLAARDTDRRLAFRIGITIGDVVERGGDLLGDGVNIAARLESLAEPGGICVSRSVHEAVANKIETEFRDLGRRRLKNIPGAIHAYAIARPKLPDGAGEEDGFEPLRRARRVGWGRRAALATLSVLTIGAAAYGVLELSRDAPTEPPPPASAGASRADGPERLAGETALSRPNGQPGGARPADQPAPRAASRPTPTRRDATPADAAALAERYAKARALEARGDRAAALRAYASLVSDAGDAIDPPMRYAALLRAGPDETAARRTLAEIAQTSASRAVGLVSALQADAEERRAKLEALAAAEPSYPPTDHFLAADYLAGRGGSPTLTERRLAFDLLDRFLEAESDGRLGRAFLDGSLKAVWLEDARRRRREIEAFFASTPTRPGASFARGETGWVATLTMPEPATAITVRVGEQGRAMATGHAQTVDPRTGKPAPLSRVTLPAELGRTVLYVSYLDRSGREAGPFPIPFDPAAAAVTAGRETLERFPETWVTFRPDIPNVLSYAQLVSHRCAIASALIGFGDEPPRTPLALPPCEPGAGASIPAGSRPVLSIPDGVDAVQVQLAYADGTESQVRTFKR
jgi:class 3 adenylate cyclase